MAIVIQHTNYSGEVLEQILTLATTGNELVERGLVHIEPNVSTKISVPRLTATKMLQKHKEQPTTEDSKGGFVYTEQTLEPKDFMVYTEFNPRALEKIWRKWQPKGNLVFIELPAEAQNKFLEELIKQVKFELGDHYINGVHGATDDELFNGIVYRMKNAEDTIKAGSSAVSMVGKLYALRSQIPTHLRTNPNLRILMSVADFDRYDRELTAQTTKGVNHTDISPKQFKGIKIEPLAKWPSDYLVATICSMGTDSNLYVAVNLQDDANVVQIDKVTNAGEKYFFKLLMKADTNIAFGQECIILEKVAPQISADITELAFPLLGDDKKVVITTSEEYVVEYVPEGYTATEYEDGVLISADSNKNGLQAIDDEIIIALKEHTSRKLRISVTQPNV